MKVIIMVCTKKICSGQMGHFGSENDSGSALRVLLRFCRMKGGDRDIKILLVVFREKNSFEAI